MVQKIITHPGGAHKDDLLATCVLIAKYGVPVERRNPTPEEIADSTLAIVDIGGVHDPSKMSFDHHQFPREHPPTCALSQVLDHLGLYEDARHFCEWLEPAEWFDSRGAKKTAEWLEVPRKAISQLNSPIDITLLTRFAQKSELSEGDPLYEFMRFVGQDLLDYLQTVRERIDFVAKVAERWSVECDGEALEAVFLPRTDPIPENPSVAVGNYIRAEGLEKTVAAVVYPDRRGEGYGIARYEDHPRLDFSQVIDEGDVRFAHQSGYMCKTSAMEPSRLRKLIAAAWVNQST